MQQYCNIQNNIIIQYNKTQHNVVAYKQYCNSTKQHNKTKKHRYNVQNNIIVLRTNITRHK